VRVISNKTLKEFSAIHPQADIALQAWRQIIESRDFGGFSDLKQVFNSVDRVGDFYVFNIGGNKYRLIVAIHFDKNRLFIRHVFTHAEYNHWRP
jgi:mRNA interferase HigB